MSYIEKLKYIDNETINKKDIGNETKNALNMELIISFNEIFEKKEKELYNIINNYEDKIKELNDIDIKKLSSKVFKNIHDIIFLNIPQIKNEDKIGKSDLKIILKIKRNKLLSIMDNFIGILFREGDIKNGLNCIIFLKSKKEFNYDNNNFIENNFIISPELKKMLDKPIKKINNFNKKSDRINYINNLLLSKLIFKNKSNNLNIKQKTLINIIRKKLFYLYK